MNDILAKITALKRKDLSALKKRLPLRVLLKAIETAPGTISLSKALRTCRVSIIAEVKKASPSKGLISSNFAPVKTALEFEKNGAAAISVLTEENFFLGNLGYLAAIKGCVGVPVLRKDFIIDEYQIYESRAAGADAILLITACLSKKELRHFIKLSLLLNMDALVETHDTKEVLTAPTALLHKFFSHQGCPSGRRMRTGVILGIISRISIRGLQRRRSMVV